MYGYYGRPPVGRYARPWVHQQYMHQQQMQQQRMNMMYPPPRAYHPSPYYDPYGYQAPMPMRPMTATERGFARRAALYGGAGAGMTVGMGAMAAGGGGGGETDFMG
ncbi:hypothetical protein QBC37DRAFT_393963 [Rhypophila decipiens]|uniref:Uncharacterized protein n=1 Tax=Rhypophila decipiens TaxID=261697 RepID=A0AAN7BG26_9PEZI|nr:hypothetical protein QBC37DRAFT_393963 [Rhypophila decipiens]